MYLIKTLNLNHRIEIYLSGLVEYYFKSWKFLFIQKNYIIIRAVWFLNLNWNDIFRFISVFKFNSALKAVKLLYTSKHETYINWNAHKTFNTLLFCWNNCFYKNILITVYYQNPPVFKVHTILAYIFFIYFYFSYIFCIFIYFHYHCYP